MCTVEPLLRGCYKGLASSDGLYGSSLVAARSAQGLGFGRQGVWYLVVLANGRRIQLHVKRNNGLAISLYRKFGFEFLSDERYEYRAMVRPAGCDRKPVIPTVARVSPRPSIP